MTAVKYKNTSVELPDDPPALKARIRELESLLQNSELRYAQLDYKLRSVLERVYGAKTDALSPAQKLLFGLLNQEAVAAAASQDPEPVDAAAASLSTDEAPARKRRGQRRNRKVPFPENLPEKRETIDLPEDQKKGLVKI